MKTKLICLLLAALFVITSCKEKDKGGMADNSMKKNSNTICTEMMNDTAMANTMMDCMMDMTAKDSLMGKTMCNKMGGNKQMMSMMMDNMIAECKKDTTMCNMMCGKMMNASHMKGMMKDMMK